MSEEQKKTTKTHYYFDSPGIPFTDCCKVVVSNGDKICRRCGAALILDITADQRAKVIRLCENVIANADNCLKEIGINNSKDSECSNCQRTLAKQLLEELQG